MPEDARTEFLSLLERTVTDGTLVKLTLGKCRSADPSLKNLFVRRVTLKAGPHLTFLWRHTTRDITKNHPPAEALAELSRLVGTDFLDAHLFTTTDTIQLECQLEGSGRLRKKRQVEQQTPVIAAPHDRSKSRPIAPDASWLRALGVTNERGQPREGMVDKFRQIQKFSELLAHLLAESGLGGSNAGLLTDRKSEALPASGAESILSMDSRSSALLRVIDMGSGKGYLTFAVASLLGERATVLGVEARKELVDLCNRVATEADFVPRLRFTAGTIAETAPGRVDVLIALHACDTATDDALAKGISAGAQLLVVSPCCQKELRSQLIAPPVLADALQHGIFQERQAEFVTDALRAQLLEWAGYRTKVFEFISTEHTARNLMIAAIKSHDPGEASRAVRIREFAAFYGIRRQQLASHLGFVF